MKREYGVEQNPRMKMKEDGKINLKTLFGKDPEKLWPPEEETSN